VAIDNVLRGPEVYLRAHALDARNVDVPDGGARHVVSATREQHRLDASPDIRVRRQPAAAVPTPIATRALGAPYDRFLINADSDAYDIWLMHSPLRATGENHTHH